MMQMSHLLHLIDINSWLLYVTDYFLQPLLDVTLCLLSVFVVLGNMLVVSAIWHENQLHSVTNYLIASLAAADCLVGLIVMPFCIVSDIIVGYWTFGPVWCDLYHSFDVLASTASIMNLCAISLDRYIAITNPIKYPSRMTPKRVALLIAFLWTCSSLISFPAIIWWRAVGKGPLQQIAHAQDQAQDVAGALSPVLASSQPEPVGAHNLSGPQPSSRQVLAQLPAVTAAEQRRSADAESLALPRLGGTFAAREQPGRVEQPPPPPPQQQQYHSRQGQAKSEPASSSSLVLASPSVLETGRSLFQVDAGRQQESPLDDVRYRCVFTDDTYYLLFSSFVSFYGPLCVMLYAYYRIYKAAIKQTRFLKHGSKQVMVGKNKRSRRYRCAGDAHNTLARAGESRSDHSPNQEQANQADPEGSGSSRHLVLRAHRGGGASTKALPVSSQQPAGQNNPGRQVNNSSHVNLPPATSSGYAGARSTPARQSEQHVKPASSLMPLMSMNSDTSTDSSLSGAPRVSGRAKLSEACNPKVKSVINEELDLDHQQAHPSAGLIGLAGSDASETSNAPAATNATPSTSSANQPARASCATAPGLASCQVQQEAPSELSNGSKQVECSQNNHLGDLIESAQTELLAKRLSFKKGSPGRDCSPSSARPARADGWLNKAGAADGASSPEVCELGEGGAVAAGSCRGQLIYYSDSDKLLQGMVDLTGMHYIDCSSSTSSNNASKQYRADSLRETHHHQHDRKDTIKSINSNDINKENKSSSSNNIESEKARKKEEPRWRSCRYDFYHRKARHRKAANELAEPSGVDVPLAASCQPVLTTPAVAAAATTTTNIVTTNVGLANNANSCEQQDVSGMLHARGQNRSVGRKLTKLAKERKAAKTLGIVVGVFILCWLPFFVVNIIVALCGTSCIYKPQVLNSIVTWLGWLNSAMNPVIYACWSRDFRRAFRRVLCTWVEFLCPYDGSNLARKLNLKKSSNYSPQEVYLNRAMSSIKGNTSTATIRSATGPSTSNSISIAAGLPNGLTISGEPQVESCADNIDRQ